MLKLRASKSRNAQRLRPREIASTVLCASLMAGIAWVQSTAAIAQTTSPGLQPPVGMRTTSPLAARSARKAGIPLDSTEIATPGISPIVPSRGGLMESCTGSDGAGSAGTLFDGGGISGTTSLSCADSRNISSPSSIGRLGIPLGETDVGVAGISPAAIAPTISNPSNP